MPPNLRPNDFNEKLRQAVEHDRLVNSVASLREDFERYERDAKERGDRQDEDIEHLKRTTSTAIHRIDLITFKALLLGAAFGALAGGAIELIVLKLLGGGK